MTFELIGREVLNFFELQVKVSTLHFLGRKVKFRILEKLSDLLNVTQERHKNLAHTLNQATHLKCNRQCILTFLEIYNQQSNESIGVSDKHFHMLE